MKMKEEQALRDLVYESLENAVANGYDDFVKGDPRKVAEDLMDCTALDMATIDQVEPHVASWQSTHQDA